VAPAIVRVPAPDRKPHRLELVEDDHHAVGVHEHGVLQLLLGRIRVVPDVGQDQVGLEAHAEQLLGGAPVEGLGELRQQRDHPCLGALALGLHVDLL
jgi:hypothetical protein